MAAIEQELIEQFQKLDAEQKKKVLDFVYSLTHPRGEPLGEIFQHASQLGFLREDLEQMKQFIEEEFERIDWDDWNNPPALSA
jgi:hypothetical protein